MEPEVPATVSNQSVEMGAESVEMTPEVAGVESESKTKEEPAPVIEDLVASHTRQRSGILCSREYSMATKVNKRTEMDPKKKEAIKQAEVAEVKLLFKELKAMQAAQEDKVDRRAHGSHICSRWISI